MLGLLFFIRGGGRCARRYRQSRHTIAMRHVLHASFPTSRIEKKEREVAATLFPRLVRYAHGQLHVRAAADRWTHRQYLVAVL
jgi:hypothetical protein